MKTWANLEAWAERNRIRLQVIRGVSTRHYIAFFHIRSGRTLARIEADDADEGAAKRAICRAVSKIREAK